MENKIKQIISDLTGAELEDITEDDSLRDDLNMSIADLSELEAKLSDNGIDSQELDWGEIITLSDLYSALDVEEL